MYGLQNYSLIGGEKTPNPLSKVVPYILVKKTKGNAVMSM